MKTLKLTSVFALTASALFFASPIQAEVVYDNSTDVNSTLFNPGLLEVGDEITLGGYGRVLTNFTFQYDGLNFSGTEKAQFRIYANDGGLVSGEASPGSILYDSGVFGDLSSGTHTLIFDEFGSWDGALPESFTWTVQFSDLGAGAQARLSIFDSITVGSSHDDYWENSGGVWLLKEGANPINFAARVEAVPEPSTIALGLMGGIVGIVLISRRQRR